MKGLTVSPGWDRLATQACGQIKWRQVTTRHPSGLQVGLELSLHAPNRLWRAHSPFKCKESPKRSLNVVEASMTRRSNSQVSGVGIEGAKAAVLSKRALMSV